MNWNVKKIWPAAAVSIAAFTAMLNADQYQNRSRNYKDRDRSPDMHCQRISICGPDMPMAVNPSVHPFTDEACCCDVGEYLLTVAGFYWQAAEDGLEFGVESKVVAPTAAATTVSAASLIDAHYLSPEFKWKPGFKIGLGYYTTHDGWDVNLLWTHYNGRATKSVDDESDTNVTLLPLWSAFGPATDAGGTILWASQANTSLRIDLNLYDLELGREFYTSKMLTLRPHIGFRGATIYQKYEIDYLGGIWDGSPSLLTGGPFTNEVNMKNRFYGGGVRAGLDTNWWFGCCPLDACPSNWGFFGNLALSLIYGKFKVEHKEFNQSPLAVTGFAKTPILETDENFHSVRAMLDLALGIEWLSLFRDSNYGIQFQLAWEFHQFFNQNQLWRVNRIGDSSTTVHGENVFAQSRGDLSTQGVTLTAKFTF
ncbi:MAG TPA: Lpg1974 family pore-forming outer membrane protein [Rhabdochlamydiaceae bacterium]|nr:Lpg1974 family pore-forming outer membrane protein [Rhabdochlamydiaceae bacterium]